MPGTLEAAAVIAIFVVPGFVGFYVSRELTPFPIRQVSDVEMVLLSTAFATVILSAEAGIYATVAHLRPDVPLLAGASPTEISDFGYRTTFEMHPSRVAAIFSGQFVLHCVVVGLLGRWDPLGKYLERARRASGTSGEDVWVLGLIALGLEKGLPSTFVRAVLDSGETYTGILSKISNSPRDDGSRDLVLQVASKASTVAETPTPLHPERPQDTVVALSTRNVRAVEAIFDDQFV